MQRADRLIRIGHLLRGQRRAVTARQIAEEVEVCTRTIYRYIQDLMASGAQISGAAGGRLHDWQPVLSAADCF